MIIIGAISTIHCPDTITLDYISNIYIQTSVLQKDVDEKIRMKIYGALIDMIIGIIIDKCNDMYE